MKLEAEVARGNQEIETNPRGRLALGGDLCQEGKLKYSCRTLLVGSFVCDIESRCTNKLNPRVTRHETSHDNNNDVTTTTTTSRLRHVSRSLSQIRIIRTALHPLLHNLYLYLYNDKKNHPVLSNDFHLPSANPYCHRQHAHRASPTNSPTDPYCPDRHRTTP